MRATAVIIGCIVVASVGQNAAASQFEFDSTFSGNGKHVLHATDGSAVTDVEVFDGDIYAAGYDVAAEFRDILVTRVSATGQVDTSYGLDGFSHVFPGDNPPFGAGLTVDGAGDVAVVGQSSGSLTIAKLNSSGSPDHTFSGDGVRKISSAGTRLAFDPDVVIDGQGRLLVGATAVTNHGYNVSIYRLLPGGSRDMAWSGDGVRTVNVSKYDWMDALAVDSHDRVILGTDTESADRPNAPATFMRFRKSGALDASFSGDGVMHVRLMQGAVAVPIAIGVDERDVVTAGLTAGYGMYGAVRIRTNGELLHPFGDGGVLGLTCDCQALEAGVVNGRTVFAAERGDGTTLVTRISRDGINVNQAWADIFPATRKETVGAVTYAGPKAVLGGRSFATAFLARVL